MKLFQRLLGGASSSNGLFGFLCFFNPMFSENEFFLNAANAFTDPHFFFRHYVAFIPKVCTEAGLDITGLDMCKVCTEAVHSVALGTRVTLQVWTCVKYVPKQSIP